MKSYAICNLNEDKYSCKGVNKRSLSNPYEAMDGVLQNKKSSRDSRIKTYQQYKKGYSYLYCERQVLANGIDTKCLDIILSPWPENNYLQRKMYYHVVINVK